VGLVEIFAVILSLAILLKFILFIFKPSGWKSFASSFLNVGGYKWISLILFVVLFYLLMQVMSIVQFMAAWLVIGLFYQAVMFNYTKSLKSMINEAWKFKGSAWLLMLIGTVLAIWTLLAVF